MTPNLQRLFEVAKGSGDEALNACDRLRDVLLDNGEALVEALEALVHHRHTPETYSAAYTASKQLLAAIEEEAGQ